MRPDLRDETNQQAGTADGLEEIPAHSILGSMIIICFDILGTGRMVNRRPMLYVAISRSKEHKVL
jgi:hypothetical protein